LKTIIYFKGVYDTLDLFTDHLIEAFESMGYGTFVYHTANEEVSKKMLLRLLDESQEFAVVTFNNLGYNLSFEQSEAAEDEEKKPEEHNIWNYFHIPYIDILMDHPFHYAGNSSDPLHRPQSCEIYPAFFQKHPSDRFPSTCRSGTGT